MKNENKMEIKFKKNSSWTKATVKKIKNKN